MAQSRRWCFTLNNPAGNDEVDLIASLSRDDVTYAVFGREVGQGGTPHLQGFVIFSRPKRFNAAKQRINNRAHLESARGTSSQAAEYCKKDGNFEEYGELPVEQGKRSDLDRFIEWIKASPLPPSEGDIAREYPMLWLRYQRRLMQLVEFHRPAPVLEVEEYREWQIGLNDELQQEADDRKVIFITDPEGGKGKSWFIRKFMSEHYGKAQFLSVGKRDDLSYAVDEFKSVFMFDIPRGNMEYLQYGILEQLKNRMIYSPKYESRTKILKSKVHVVVFSNEQPDYEKLTEDRYDVREI